MCFSSRKDFQIKHNGHRIELGEIEMAINSMDGIQRACCIYQQDENNPNADNQLDAALEQVRNKINQ